MIRLNTSPDQSNETNNGAEIKQGGVSSPNKERVLPCHPFVAVELPSKNISYELTPSFAPFLFVSNRSRAYSGILQLSPCRTLGFSAT